MVSIHLNFASPAVYFRGIVIVSTVLLALAGSCHAKLTKECLVDYLEFRHVQDDSFDSIDSYSGDPGTCSDEVRAKVNDIYGVTRSKMDAHIKQKPYADCVMRDIENEKYENLLLKAEVIEMKGVGIKFWQISSKNSRVEELKRQAQELVDNALIKCKGQSDYGAFFDTFFEQKRSEPMTDEFDYCMRKHLSDKAIINSTFYSFRINPKNLRTAGIDCEQIMAIELAQMRSSIAGTGTSCVIDSFLNNGYLELIMKIQLLSKLTLTPPEKETERQKFIDAMITMTHKIKTCPMS